MFRDPYTQIYIYNWLYNRNIKKNWKKKQFKLDNLMLSLTLFQESSLCRRVEVVETGDDVIEKIGRWLLRSEVVGSRQRLIDCIRRQWTRATMSCTARTGRAVNTVIRVGLFRVFAQRWRREIVFFALAVVFVVVEDLFSICARELARLATSWLAHLPGKFTLICDGLKCARAVLCRWCFVNGEFVMVLLPRVGALEKREVTVGFRARRWPDGRGRREQLSIGHLSCGLLLWELTREWRRNYGMIISGGLVGRWVHAAKWWRCTLDWTWRCVEVHASRRVNSLT